MVEHTSKRRKLKTSGGSDPSRGDTITDSRFASVQSDPRYRLPSKRHTHVKVDKRFSRVLKDVEFSRKAKVDRYGRPLETDAEQKRLKRRFDFEDEDEDEENGVVDDDEVQQELRRVEKTYDPLRDGRDSPSSSEESSSDDEEDGPENDMEDAMGASREGNIPMGEVSARIAVVNLDWDNIRAEDLMAVFSSFLPSTGRLTEVAIYPSEFGKERMAKEEMEGPPKEIFSLSKSKSQTNQTSLDIESDESNDDDETIKKSILKPDDGSEFDSTALRQYQLERLRYFYAILTFSSPSTAKHIYDAVDGTEYLSSANFFDLRFVPDETKFDDKAKEECQKIPDGYKPNEFVTDALQHSKVRLTWDAEDGSRKEAQARAFRGSRKEIDENDLKAYLGSDSSDDEDPGFDAREEPASEGKAAPLSKKEQERQKMRTLLGLPTESVKTSTKKERGPVGDVQITFSSGLSGANGTRKSVFENEPEPDETTVERYVRKEKERKQKRREKMKTARGEVSDGLEDAEEEQSAMLPINEDEADLGFDDPFFTEPSNDRASASKMRKEDRLKKRAERAAEEAASKAERAQLELLMLDDQNQTGGEGGTMRHFDMKEIERAEKKAMKKGKKSKKSTTKADGARAAAAEEDAFHIDAQDPRFAGRLFENHEFAIDPTNPRFKGTKAMKALLDEGRRRKDKTASLTMTGSIGAGKALDGKKSRGGDGVRDDDGHGGHSTDVRRLVEKMKKKSRKVDS